MKQNLLLVASSAGLGMLLGGITGLSSSPVAAIVLGALTPFGVAFATWFGSKQVSPTIRPTNYMIAVAAISWFAVFGVIAGVIIRTHGLLSPSPESLVRRWTDAHFPVEQARLLAQAELLGAGHASSTALSAANGPPLVANSVLFADTARTSPMQDLQGLVVGGNLEEIKKAFKKNGGPLGEAVSYVETRAFSKPEQTAFLQGFYTVLRNSSQ